MTDINVTKVLPRLSSELKISAGQIAAVAKLFAEGNTIPFIARYRKEAHGNLDEVQISQIQERLTYYGELEERRAVILKSIDEQGKLTDDLRAKIEACQQKAALEDLYQPYKPKRRTRASLWRMRSGRIVSGRRTLSPPPPTTCRARATSSPSASPTWPRCAGTCARRSPRRRW